MNNSNDLEGGSPLRDILHNVSIVPDRQRDEGPSMGVTAEEDAPCVPLCYASIKGGWKKAEDLSNDFPCILRRPINIGSETALHIAVTLGHVDFVKNILLKMWEEDLIQEDVRGKTAFSIAAESGNIEIARLLFQKNNELPMIEGHRDGFPIELAARYGHHKMVSYLYEILIFSNLIEANLGRIFLSFISAEMFDVAMTMMEKEEKLENVQGLYGETALSIMASKPSAFTKREQLHFFQKLLKNICRVSFRETQLKITAQQLVVKLWTSVHKLTEQQSFDYLNHPLPRLIFEAASNGNMVFLRFFLASYPKMLYEVDEKGHTIFHIAALLRHEAVFSQIYHIGAMKEDIVSRLDKYGNCMLHLVAALPSNEKLNLVSGAALQMQHEILWYQAVEKLVPRDYLQLANFENETPHDVFVREHKTLRAEGEKWMKDTATSCMIVAALLINVVFAAAFTVPCGYSEKDESTGFPNFGNKGWFFVFIVTDSIGLFTLITCLLIFLSIMTSRYKEIDFKTVLPLKLMMGLLALYMSIICMLLSFISTMTLIRHQPHHWTLIVIYTFGVLAVISYVILHAKLWLETFRSTFFLFRRGNKTLF